VESYQRLLEDPQELLVTACGC